MAKYLTITGLIILISLLGFAVFSGTFKDTTQQSSNNRTDTLQPSSNNASSTPVASSMKGETLNRTVTLYFVALEDNGKSGEKIGCDDSLVPLSTNEPLKSDPKEAAKQTLGMLFASQEENTDQKYNSLSRSSLKVDKVEENAGKVAIYISGDLKLGGTCDSPRVQSQIENTAKQSFSNSEIEIFINNTPLAEALSQQ